MLRKRIVALAAAGLIAGGLGALQTPAFAVSAADTVTTASPRHTMVNWATSEMSSGHNHGVDQNGVYNCNYYTGHFNGAQSGCPSGYRGGDWCADFVHYIWQLTGGVSDLSQLDGYAQSFKTYGTNHGTWHAASSSYTPQPGDAIVYPDNNGNGLADHVGLVVSASGNSVTTIEGNTNYEVISKATVSKTAAQGYTSPVIPQPTGAITNTSAGGIGLGVIHLADDNYGKGTYDVVLPGYEDTYHDFGWAEAAGGYIGSGYKAHIYSQASSGALTLVKDVTGPTNFFFPKGGNWVVEGYPS